DHLLGIADEQVPLGVQAGVELVAGDAGPTALATDTAHGLRVWGEEDIGCGAGVGRDEAVRVDRQWGAGSTGRGGSSSVNVGERSEAFGHPTDDRQDHAGTEVTGPGGRLRRTAHRDPDR